MKGVRSAQTASNGLASLTSPSTRSRGTLTFTVTGVVLAGDEYALTSNAETSDSITR